MCSKQPVPTLTMEQLTKTAILAAGTERVGVEVTTTDILNPTLCVAFAEGVPSKVNGF